MTKEEAIYCMKSYINDNHYEHCTNCPYYAKNKVDDNTYVCESETAHKMAIKALEQEPILDKIKAEIRKLKHFPANSEDKLFYNAGLLDSIEIIDKYKAESEK